MIVVSLC